MTAARPDTWMPLYIGDYLKDTTHLGCMESGAYLHLLMHYWSTGAPLPDNDRALSRIARADGVDHWVSDLRPSLQQFFRIADGHWHHKRVDAELAAADEKQQAARKRAKKAAEARWADTDTPDAPSNASSMHDACSKHAPSTPQAMLEECPSPSPSPIDHHHITARGIAEAFTDARERFWPQEPTLPAPLMTIEAQAAEYLKAGAPPDVLRDLVTGAVEKFSREDRGPPKSLAAFRHSLPQQIRDHKQAQTPVELPDARPRDHSTPRARGRRRPSLGDQIRSQAGIDHQ